MFEAYSSPAHQSAVDRLIQLATGKKRPAHVEDEPASQEAAVPLSESLHEASAASAEETLAVPEPHAPEERSEAAEGELVPEAAVESVAVSAVEEAHFPVEAESVDAEPVETEISQPIEAHVHEDGIGSEAESARVEEDAFEHAVAPIAADESTVPEEQVETHIEASHAQEEAAHLSSDEPAPEHSEVDSSRNIPEHSPEYFETPPTGYFTGYSFEHPDDHALDDATDHVFHAEPVESALVESVLAEHELEHADEPLSEPEVAAETAQPAEEEHNAEYPEHFDPPSIGATIEEQHFGEAPAELLVEEALADESAKALAVHASIEEPVSEAMAESANAEAVDSSYIEAVPEPYKLEKYQSSADREPDAADQSPNVVPSSHDTTYLKSKDLSESPGEEEWKELARDPMWKTLMQFKGWLPLVTRVLPLLDIAGSRAGQASPLATAEMKDAIHGLAVSQRDLRLTMQDQTLELKRVEEEVARLRDTTDKTAFEQTVTGDEVKAMRRLLKNAFLYVGILLGLLVVAVGYMGFLVFTYLNHPVQ